MSQPPPSNPPPDPNSASSRAPGTLGLSTEGLAGLSIDELKGNKVALTMLMHNYSALLSENASLKNDLNTANTYIAGYARKKSDSAIGAILLLISNVLLAFGINYVTGDGSRLIPGVVMTGAGLLMAALGAYYSFKDR